MSKRILLIRNAYHYDFGGGELFPTNLATILSKNGYKPILISQNPGLLKFAQSKGLRTARGPWLSHQDFSGLSILLFPVYCLWQLLLFFWYLGAIVYYRPAAVHPQSRDDFVAATLAAKLLFRVIVWSDHADLKHIYASHKVWYKNPIGKLVYFIGHLANDVTIESNSEKRLIEESLGKELPYNYRVIHIGVADSYKPIRKNNKNLVLVATSRLVEAKGIGELIEAFKTADIKGAVLKLCGDGPDSHHFKSLAADNPRIEFLGHVNNVTEILSSADIFVHPTYHEGFGLSLVEAEMCGLPIIASDVGSIPEIVKNGESGILVPSKNVRKLVEAIQTLAKNPELRAKMGKTGREIYLENFQFDKIVKERFIPLYEK